MRTVGFFSCLGIFLVSSVWAPLTCEELPATTPPPEIRSSTSNNTGDIIQSLNQQALPDLIHSITEKTPHLRLISNPFLGDVQDPHEVSTYLVRAYKQTTEEGVRCKILESIGRFHDRAELEWLIERLDDPHVNIQCFAIWALGELRDMRASDALMQKLWNANRYVQMTAIDALGKMGKSRVVATEIGVFLRDDDVQVRYLAAKALFNVAGPEMVDELLDRLEHESSIDVQDVLAKAIGHSGEQKGAHRLSELLKSTSSQAMEHWAEVGLRAVRPGILVPILAPLLEGNDFRIKISAARILSELDMPLIKESDNGWMQRVMRWSQGPDLVVRAAAAQLLERMESTP
jgi:HEAT repeat protein